VLKTELFVIRYWLLESDDKKLNHIVSIPQVPLVFISNYQTFHYLLLTIHCPTGMTFPAHNRPLLFRLVAALAVQMKCLAQPRPVAGAFLCMAVGAALIFRGLVGNSFAAFVYMVAFIAFLDLSGFIVVIMPKNSRWPPLNLKTVPRHHHHILLANCRHDKKNSNEYG
jgi:hypothetical protein